MTFSVGSGDETNDHNIVFVSGTTRSTATTTGITIPTADTDTATEITYTGIQYPAGESLWFGIKVSGYKPMSGVSTTDVVELEIEPNIDTTLTFADGEDETFLNNADNQTALTYLIDSKMGIELTFDNVAEELEVQGNYARLIFLMH